jgi:ribosomal-protein-serine acetyltransferase
MFRHVISDDADLVPIEPRYAEECYALIDSNRKHLGRWFSWVDETKSPDDTRSFMAGAVKRCAERGDITAAIRVDSKIAGLIGLEDMNNHLKSAEIGYWLGAEYEGKGLVTKACRALLNHAFNTLGLERVQIRVDPANIRSRAIPRRLGFHYEGTLRHVWRNGDRYSDLEIYSILRDEWAE